MTKGFAHANSTTQMFLDACPAVICWMNTADTYFSVFDFDPGIDVPIVPPGVYFEPSRADEDETQQLSACLLHHEIDRLDESNLRGEDDEKTALHELLVQEGFGGRENGILDFDAARRVAIERLAWLRDQRAEGLR